MRNVGPNLVCFMFGIVGLLSCGSEVKAAPVTISGIVLNGWDAENPFTPITTGVTVQAWGSATKALYDTADSDENGKFSLSVDKINPTDTTVFVTFLRLGTAMPYQKTVHCVPVCLSIVDLGCVTIPTTAGGDCVSPCAVPNSCHKRLFHRRSR